MFSDIWKRTEEDDLLPSTQFDSSEQTNNTKRLNEVSLIQDPSGFSENELSLNKNSQYAKKKNSKEWRDKYQRSSVRSDDQHFNFHTRQSELVVPNKNPLIEEETKSGNNLNLSTSSRSYRPGISKSKSIIFQNEDQSLSTSQKPVYFPNYQPSMLHPENQQFVHQPAPQNIPMGGNAMINQQIPPHYNYSMGIPPPGMVPISQQMPFQHKQGILKQSNSFAVYNKVGSYAGETLLEANQDEIKGRHSLNSPTTQAVATMPASNLTSGSASPPTSEFTFGNGFLKFFNQQHQYGFIVSEQDGSDIFFHYDDVKHTQLSKEFLRHATENFWVKFNFKILGYVGKYDSSKKAVDINLLSIVPIVHVPHK